MMDAAHLFGAWALIAASAAVAVVVLALLFPRR